jgi:hypothetical protein
MNKKKMMLELNYIKKKRIYLLLQIINIQRVMKLNCVVVDDI